MLNIFKPCRFGILIGAIYLLVAIPCACMHWYEYSIPAMIVYYSSFPAIIVLSGVEFIGVKFHLMDGWIFRVSLLVTQTAIYFLFAEGLSFMIRKIFSYKFSKTTAA